MSSAVGVCAQPPWLREEVSLKLFTTWRERIPVFGYLNAATLLVRYAPLLSLSHRLNPGFSFTPKRIKRGQPHRHNSKYKKGTDGNKTNRTKENMQDEKQARTKRYGGLALT